MIQRTLETLKESGIKSGWTKEICLPTSWSRPWNLKSVKESEPVTMRLNHDIDPVNASTKDPPSPTEAREVSEVAQRSLCV